MSGKKTTKTVVDTDAVKPNVDEVVRETVDTEVLSEQELSMVERYKKDAEDAMNFALRTKADMENMKKRNSNIASEMFYEGKIDAVSRMLPIFDNIDRALTVEMPQEIRLGIEKIAKMASDILTKLGISEVASMGEVFDPSLHNAMMQTDNEEMSGKVVQVFEKGYKLGDKVLRHASVVVAK